MESPRAWKSSSPKGEQAEAALHRDRMSEGDTLKEGSQGEKEGSQGEEEEEETRKSVWRKAQEALSLRLSLMLSQSRELRLPACSNTGQCCFCS